MNLSQRHQPLNDHITNLNVVLTSRNVDLQKLNALLDKLIILLYHKAPNPLERNNLVLAVINCCYYVPSDNHLLVAKCSNFMYNVIHKQKVSFEPKELDIIVPWLCETLKRSTDIAYLDILQVVEYIIQNHSDYFTKNCDNLLEILLSKLEDKAKISFPIDVKISRLTCLKNLFQFCSKKKQVLVAKEFLDSVYNISDNEIIYQRNVWLETIEALGSFALVNQDWFNTYTKEVMGLVLSAVEYGFDGQFKLKPAYPCSIVVPPPASSDIKGIPKITGDGKVICMPLTNHAKNLKAKRVIWSNEEESEGVQTGDLSFYNTNYPLSESDLSDSEGGDKTLKLYARLRHAAFNLVIQLVKSFGCKPLYGYYTQLVSKLLNSLRKETLIKPKIAALAAITALLRDSKLFLAQAQYREGGAFTTFSESLAELIFNLFTVINQCLKSQHPLLIPPLLHTLATLISVSPFQRLYPNLLTNSFDMIQTFLSREEHKIATGVLLCLMEIVILNPNCEEQKIIIGGNSENPPWLLNHCLKIVNEDKLYDVKIASWEILMGLCQFHYDVIKNHLEILEKTILKHSEIHDDCQYHVAKTLDCLLTKLSQDDNMFKHRIELWKKLIGGPIISLANSDNHKIGFKTSALACDCFSSIGHEIYNALDDDMKIIILTIVISCSQNQHALVRAAAVNTLGVFLLFPQLIDEQFVCDTKDILIKSFKDSNDSVRSKAAWAMGNLVELLTQNQFDFFEEIKVLELLNAGLSLAEDNQKVRGNIVRPLGHLILTLTEEELNNQKYKVIVEKVCNFFLNCASSGTHMKMRWNACYAIGTILKNDDLYKTQTPWMNNVINCLSALVVKCGNFKVRAIACNALCSIKLRESFSNYYYHVWSSLLEGLENAANMTDFREYKHQGSLIEHICLAICHLTSLMAEEDLNQMEELMRYRMENFETMMIQFLNNLPPEKTSLVLIAANRIRDFNSSQMPSELKNFLNSFYSVFKIRATV